MVVKSFIRLRAELLLRRPFRPARPVELHPRLLFKTRTTDTLAAPRSFLPQPLESNGITAKSLYQKELFRNHQALGEILMCA